MSKHPLKKRQLKPNLELVNYFRDQGYKKVVGLDEVGRGALAGPLVVAAVEINASIPQVTDSKLLTASQRFILVNDIYYNADQVVISQVSNEEIDKLGLAAAQAIAYHRALEQVEADLILTDNYFLNTGHKYIRAVKGDQLFYPVAAASIVAKVSRDQLMSVYHNFFPAYGWRKNMGYGTRFHLDALSQTGHSHLHRQSFLKKKPPHSLSSV